MPQPAQVAALRDQLLELYRRTAQEIEARLAELATADVRTAVLRRRLAELAASIRHEMAVLDAATRGWIQEQLPLIYGAGAADAAAQVGARFAWTQIHVAAVHQLANDLHGDLLSATRFVTADTKRFVREAARNATRRSIVGGDTARQAGRDLAGQLETAFGARPIAAVRYANGARHSLDSYSEMVLRTKTAQAFNVGALTSGRESNVEWVEIADGSECGWTEHDDPDLADGSIRTLDEAMANPLSHPNCTRAVLMRPDLTGPDGAHAAGQGSGTDDGPPVPATQPRAAVQQRQAVLDRRAARLAR